MESTLKQTSPESDVVPVCTNAMDERKRKRMLRNRESARRSRLNKQKQMGDLVNAISTLSSENLEISKQIDEAKQRYNDMESQNQMLRAQESKLAETLRSLNSVLEMAKEISGLALDIPEISEPMQNPWRIPWSAQPIMASADTFEC